MILSCQNIKFSYIDEHIFTDISFHVNEHEQTAIVGPNGAGKTTLLRLLNQELNPDSGTLSIKSGTTIGYLHQNITYDSESSVYDELYQADQALLNQLAKLGEYEALMQEGTPSEETIQDYHNVLSKFESMNGYSYESQVRGILNGLGFDENMWDRPVNKLSGGQKTRLALGRLLLQKPDLLFLDEPTNHLDLSAIQWLENFLNSYEKTLILVSHDRYFLDRVVNKIIDLDNGKTRMFEGNYTQYIQKKELIQAIDEKHYEEQQAEIKRQEAVIQKLRSFNQEKFIKRAQSREKVLDRMERMDRPFHLRTDMTLHLSPKRESGNDVLTLKELSIGYPPLTLMDHVNLDIYRGERIALIGANGSGKTSLFKVLMGQQEALDGQLRFGSGVEIAYYDQEYANLTLGNTLIEEIADDFPTMEISKIRNILASFLFTGDDVFKEVSSLSGGEKGRISLAKMMLAGGNFLLLDEPTNHLDMISKEILENALIAYSGTVFFISHDRYFINRVATRVVELEDKKLTSYIGDYDYYLEKKSEITSSTSNGSSTLSSSPSSKSEGKEQWEEMKRRQREQAKLDNKIQELENQIETFEKRIEAIDELLTHEDIFSSYEKSNELIAEKNQLETSLEKTMETWENLQV